MKKWEDLSMEDLRSYLNKVTKKHDNNFLVTVIAIMGIVALIATVAVAIVKLAERDKDNLYDEFDDDDAFYVDENRVFED